MNLQPHNDAVPRTYAGEAEETLRLIAGLAAPDGLEDRVQAVLARAPRTAPVLPWPLDRRWMHGTLARGAAAAAIVCFVAGGGWEVYSRVQPVQAPKVIAMPRVATPGGFASANAMRTPKTVNGPNADASHRREDSGSRTGEEAGGQEGSGESGSG